MIQVLIIEDDPMVAELNRQYVNKVDGFTVIGHASNPAIALELLTQTKVDLLLLDIHMPVMGGLDFLRRLREEKEDVDVILITAASEMNQIQQALRLGAIDYLIKPFEFSRFQESLMQYKTDYYNLDHKNKVSQQELDCMLRKKNKPVQRKSIIPKGLTKATLKRIIDLMGKDDSPIFSTEDIAEISSISRVSVRKYLKFLTEIGYLEEHLVYGIGRPIYQYKVIKSNQYLIAPYL
ncbi:Two-component response regulator, malate [Planococcus halocryophilus Or1]|uniref:Transcriptional regulatory protein n=1 Tax=Planococcus halocryophilus TaxID=1215089 RepID=A0A1C7DVR6_9BACL|nr:response regulator [Planococcus halocryophilus]ANU15313.1 two-component system response regulator DcuR [Planococcus halocryophilus]EMF47671.1 Two-component response regulator, malate [Planococcus halocryophilus Or1]